MQPKFTLISGEGKNASLNNHQKEEKTPKDLEREKYLKDISDFLAKEKEGEKNLSHDLIESEIPFFRKTIYFTEVMLKKCQENPDEDYSRQILTLSFHYYALGLYSKAKELISFIKPSYFKGKAIEDMTRSISARNKSEEYSRKNKPNLAKKYQIEARFFLSMIYLIPFMKESKELNGSPEFRNFLKKISEKPYVITLAPYIGVFQN